MPADLSADPAGAASARLFAFDNTYARLPERFYAKVDPTPVGAPRLIRLNAALAETLGVDPDALASSAGLAALTGCAPPAGAEPLAMAYAGHQFGAWVPQLGDGRALLLGEVIGADGLRRDVQLKGAGRTPFSRMGDGRAPLGPVLREYIVSEAMAALGVPTTRALAAAATGEPVFRETTLPGGVLTRVARAHIRVGTFQFFAARDDVDGLRRLADYAIERLYPALSDADAPYLGLLSAVLDAQARLVAAWMGLGFIHGVMNTDNMAISGETIDYGPCAFVDAYDPETVFSSIDQMGRYAYVNQPAIAHWNLAVLAQALLPLLASTQEAAVAKAQAAVDAFPDRYRAAWTDIMRRKLGLGGAAADDDALARGFLDAMAAGRADFTLSFRRLAEIADPAPDGDAPLQALFAEAEALELWLERWRARREADPLDDAAAEALMKAQNPAIIPRNHQVEAALSAASAGDEAPFHSLVDALTTPYADRAPHDPYATPPTSAERVRATFCGT